MAISKAISAMRGGMLELPAICEAVRGTRASEGRVGVKAIPRCPRKSKKHPLSSSVCRYISLETFDENPTHRRIVTEYFHPNTEKAGFCGELDDHLPRSWSVGCGQIVLTALRFQPCFHPLGHSINRHQFSILVNRLIDSLVQSSQRQCILCNSQQVTRKPCHRNDFSIRRVVERCHCIVSIWQENLIQMHILVALGGIAIDAAQKIIIPAPDKLGIQIIILGL